MPDAITEREFTAEQRRELADKGQAMPDGSFPIANASDLSNAIQAFGRAKNKAAVKRHIIKRARALGKLDMLPDDWRPGMTEAETGTDSLLESARILEAVPGGKEWEVLLIEPGVSKNGRYYPPDVLTTAAPLFEGAYSYARHRRTGEGERHPNDKIGRFSQVRATEAGLQARFKAIAPWVRDLLREAMDGGEPDFVGFSIDAAGRVVRREHEGRSVSWVEAITQVNSVDLVAEPAAGGRVVRLVASAESEIPMDPEEIKSLVAEQTAAAVAAATPNLVTALMEAIKASPGLMAAASPPEPTPPQTDGALALKEAQDTITEAKTVVFEGRVDRALAGATGLSDLGKQRIKRDLMDRFTRRSVADDEVTAAIKEAADYEAGFRQQQPTAVARIQMGDAESDKRYKGLVGWFAGADEDGVPAFRSLREAYCRWKGLDYFDGFNPIQYVADFAVGSYDSALHHGTIKESLTTSSWAQIFADVQYLMITRAYRANAAYAKWRMLVSQLESVPDFQTRHWARIGGYGDLVAVAQGGTYQPMTSPGDEEITYVISKRGGVDDITMEMLLADRVNRVRQLPVAMARAAARTLFKFVVNMATTDNPTVDYDSTALYIAGHSNTGTTALTVAGLDTTETAMREQTAFGESSEIIGERNKPAVLVVPNELRARANRIVNPSDTYAYGLNSSPDADASLDPQQYKGSGIQVLVADHFTDATDWFAVANPAEVETLVIGFLNGSQEPELFVQDSPTAGSMFTADKITYKVRHIYGGDVLDHRSFYRQVVA